MHRRRQRAGRRRRTCSPRRPCDGKLATRADAAKHQGDFRKIVQGVNDTLDAVIGPLNVAAEYVDRISKGDIPAKITDNYNGDFNEIKNNLNQCIDADQRPDRPRPTRWPRPPPRASWTPAADEAKFQGKYREIIRGMNKTLRRLRRARCSDIGEALKRLASKDFSQARRDEVSRRLRRAARQRQPGGRQPSARRSSRSPRAPASSPKARG